MSLSTSILCRFQCILLSASSCFIAFFSLSSDGYTAVTSHQPGKLGKLTTRHQAVPHHQQQEPFWERKTSADTPRSHTASHK